ncbi:MAG: PilZ domain-containing protein [Gammaproteobacteria bacterium]|nr:PilZ domain-containing protein [Gammaproteobacteria bacterium]
MEHRWGKRISVNLPVQLQTRGGIVTAGRILNISRTGALIKAQTALPVFARVDVYVNDRSMPSYVARADGDLLGVEWCDSPVTRPIMDGHAA